MKNKPILKRITMSLVAAIFALSLIVNVNYCESKANEVTNNDNLEYGITAGISLYMMKLMKATRENNLDQFLKENNIDTSSAEDNTIPVENVIRELVIESRNEKKFVAVDKLNIRDYPDINGTEIEGYLNLNDSVIVTGVTTDNDGNMWGRIVYDDGDSWIYYSYLSDTETEVDTWSEEDTYNYSWSGEVLNKRNGVVVGPIGKESYYNLPMGRVVQIMKDKGYNYEYWVRSDGVKMFGEYVMVAADLSRYPKGSLVSTTLGTGIVCDTGDFVYSTDRALDIAVSW